MTHVATLLEFEVTNSLEEPITVSNIKFTAPSALVGTFYIDFTDNIEVESSGPTYTSKSATLIVKNGEAIEAGESAKFYLPVAPFEAAANAKLSIEVNVTAGEKFGVLAKKITLAKATTFKAGKIKNVKVNYDAEFVEVNEDWVDNAYNLVTSASHLNAGDKVIITNKKGESSTVRVMMTTMYDSSKIKLSSDYTTITSNIEIAETALPENTAVFTVEEGATAGTFAFKAEGVGYLNGGYDDAAWSSFLNYSSTLEAGASWTVELISNGAKMSSCYNGSSTRFLNNYDNYKMNYANSRSTSYHYYIFYMDGEAQGEPEQPEQPVVTPLATPVVSATASANSVTVAWDAVAGAKDYTVTCGTATQTVTASPATFTDLEFATEYTVSVVANPTDDTLNTASEAGVATVTTEAAQGGAEGLVVALTLPVEGAVVDATANTFYESDIIISSTGGWRIQSEGSSWTGLFLGSGKNIKVAVADSSKHEITKVEMTAESSGTLNFRDFTSGSTLVWEPGYGASSKTFTAGSATRVATITVYYKAK
jgi:hypothetical protein